MFQSRNRGSFDFKTMFAGVNRFHGKFQSRNRGSFDFKPNEFDYDEMSLFEFQSRNRGSFDFKYYGFLFLELSDNLSFNLVIEVLLISSVAAVSGTSSAILFQSRNRGSFDFKK